MSDPVDRWLLPDSDQNPAVRVFYPLDHIGVAVSWGPDRVLIKEAGRQGFVLTPEAARIMGQTLLYMADFAQARRALREEYERYRTFVERCQNSSQE